MPNEYSIKPGERLGPVFIGMNEDELIRVLGPARERQEGGGISLFWDVDLRVALDDGGAAEFVELSWRTDGPAVMYGGVDLLRAPAEEVAELLERTEGGHYAELQFAFDCPSGLALWRPVLPVDDGEAAEYRDGRYWATVAVAAPGYW